MTAFSDTFGAIVVPALRELLDKLAVPVAYENMEFTDAVQEITREAARRGLHHLPEHLQVELDGWICITLCQEVAKHIPAVTEHQAMLDRVGADVRRWEIELARYVRGQRQWQEEQAFFLMGQLG